MASTKKGGKSKKGSKAPSGYQLFLKERTAELKKQYGQDKSVIDEVRGDWGGMSDAKKGEWKKKAAAQAEKSEKA